MILAPSILSANFNELQKNIDYLDKHNVEFLHIDIMDGKFVPNFTFGPIVLKNLKHKMVKDVHLMVFDPVLYANYFKAVDPDYITFHYEATDNVLETIEEIKKMNVKVGISIKPGTDVKVLDEYLDKVDLILIMSVEPGFGGQKFMDNSLPKIEYLSNQKKEKGYKYLIEVDGGIDYQTAILCAEKGCEVAVAGTYIFNFVKNEDEEGLAKAISHINSL